jgi:predicted nucleic acid-binding protein
MMAAEALGEPLFLDTSLIIAATVEAHPGHRASAAFVDARVAEGRSMCTSLQVCREFLVVLTRQPVSGRVFALQESLAALQVWLTGCKVLEEDMSVLQECLRLVQQFSVLGKQVHDCNIVATMIAHGVRHLATRNPADFKRYGDLLSVTAVED